MYNDIKEQFKSVIRFSQGIEDPQVDELFERWAKAKEKFIKRFGGLIYEWSEPIEFKLDSGTKKTLAADFANTVSETFNNRNLAEFIDENLDTFFENKVSKNLGQDIPQGMKLVKAFKFFENDKKTLRHIQDMASKVIEENKIKGTLCFSVHPLDFLSSSENTYNWRSCHSLDGDYRSGNLSYMVDTATFMVYIKGANDQKIPAFGSVEWNSKKWRVLFHASDNDEILFAGRQYPFTSKHGLDIVLNIYNNLYVAETIDTDSRGKYRPWTNGYVSGTCTLSNGSTADLAYPYVVYDNSLIPLRDLVQVGANALNYNDMLHSSVYRYPYYTILNTWWIYHNADYIQKNPVVVGGEVNCLQCGDNLILASETMRCHDCELKYGTEENSMYGFCDCCGARVYLDDAICLNNGDIVCNNCYENECFTCSDCEDVFYDDNRHYYHNEETGEEGWYCDECYERHVNE